MDNYIVEEGGEYPMENQNHHFDDIDFGIYLTEEEHNFFAQEEDGHMSEIDSGKKSRENKQSALVDGDKTVSSFNLQT